MRISVEDDPHNVIELMEKHWKLFGDEPPLICISVIGGTYKIKLEGMRREMFYEVI